MSKNEFKSWGKMRRSSINMRSLKESSIEEEQDSWKKVSQEAQENDKSINEKLQELYKLNFFSQRSLKHKEGLLRERIELKKPTHFLSDDLKRLKQKFSSIKQAVKEKRGVEVKAVGFFCDPNHQRAASQQEEEKVAFDHINISHNSNNSVSNAEPCIFKKR